jgi:UDP-N-acetylmuramoylalanine--D-glutamate ligase
MRFDPESLDAFDPRGLRVVVVGMGRSGVAAATLLHARGAEVVAADTKPHGSWSDEARALVASGAVRPVLLPEESVVPWSSAVRPRPAVPPAYDAVPEPFRDVHLIVVSPGVPNGASLEAAAAWGVPIWSELELGVRAARPGAQLVAVGGTNGKSTTTELVGALFRGAGAKVFVGGNLGEPFSFHAHELFDAVVLETSSFQLERVHRFRPDVAILLNISSDHLDRYATFADYAAAKGNAFVRQGPSDLAVVSALDPEALAQASRGAAQRVTFGPAGDWRVDDRSITSPDGKWSVLREDIPLRGTHNAYNVAAALAATVGRLGVNADNARATLRGFRGLAHRMQWVGETGGVRFYDDSKGTNVGAAVTALLGLDEPRAVLIAGGKDKGGSYAPLGQALAERGRAVVLIGEAAPLIEQAVSFAVPTVRAKNMGEAVRLAWERALPGDAVLLSPACSSFDMFRDYKERGDVFAGAVRELVRAAGGSS